MWEANIKIQGKQKFLGAYPTEVEAATAYDLVAKDLHGGFARLNFPTIDYTDRQFIPIIPKETTSQYRGVHVEKKTGMWVAAITHNGQAKHIGTYTTEEEAAHMWDATAILLRGSSTTTNFL